MDTQNNNSHEQWNKFRSQENNPAQPSNSHFKKSHKGLIIFMIVLAIFAGIVALFIFLGLGDIIPISFLNKTYSSQSYDTNVEHISVIDINGTISESSTTPVYEVSSYNQQWLINTIEDLMNDENNKGIILNLNTPGGSVYATDEVYMKLMEYKENTQKPIYAAMGSTCASGGYYIACAADKIYANRNTITGSIGVTLGTSIDISQLLENYGVNTTTLASGANKAMGNIYSPLTQEQKDIYMSLINECYEQFTGIVALGRGMELETVKALADGRIYTAQQAAANGLIDGVMNYDDTIKAFQADNKTGNCPVYTYSYQEELSIYNMLFGLADKLVNKSADSYDNEISAALKMAEEGNYNQPYYIMK